MLKLKQLAVGAVMVAATQSLAAPPQKLGKPEGRLNIIVSGGTGSGSFVRSGGLGGLMPPLELRGGSAIVVLTCSLNTEFPVRATS